MKIYTSNFANAGKAPNPVAISKGVPIWFKGQVYKALAPTWELVNAYKKDGISVQKYEKRYFKLLADRGIKPEKVLAGLSVYNEDEVTLLCWEAPNKFCHRRLIADWLVSSGLIDEVPEWGIKKGIFG